MSYALFFVAGMVTAVASRRLVDRITRGSTSLGRAVRQRMLAESDHDRLLMFRDDVEAEIVRRAQS